MSIFHAYDAGQAPLVGQIWKAVVDSKPGAGNAAPSHAVDAAKEQAAPPPRPKKKHAGKAILAGGISGGIEICITYPTEYVKTRMQLYPEEGRRGPIQCAKLTVQSHGVTGLYRGLVSLLYFSIPKVAVRFGAYEFANNRLQDPKTGEISQMRTLACGLFAGVMEAAVVVTPTETMKVRLIHDQLQEKPRFRGFFHGVRTIVAEQGLSGTYRGFLATLMKQGSNQAIRFVVYNQMKIIMLGRNHHAEGKKFNIPQTAVAGAVAGAASVFGNTPLDVIKTKMQGLDSNKYRSVMHCAQDIWQTQGFFGFYRGTTARLGRVCADVAIVFVLYEQVMKALDAVWKTE